MLLCPKCDVQVKCYVLRLVITAGLICISRSAAVVMPGAPEKPPTPLPLGTDSPAYEGYMRPT